MASWLKSFLFDKDNSDSHYTKSLSWAWRDCGRQRERSGMSRELRLGSSREVPGESEAPGEQDGGAYQHQEEEEVCHGRPEMHLIGL